MARPSSGTRHSHALPAFSKPVQSLRTPPSRYGRQVRYCVYEFDNLLDSSNINVHGWDSIAQAVDDNYGRFDGFVILHGTDSLAYSASALSFMFENLGKPVVLTGSQAPVWQLQTDASDNLLGALVVAGHFMIPEVCLFFNKALLRGNRSTKVSADAFAAFASPNLSPLATVSGMRTRVNWDLVCRPGPSPFTVRYGLDTSCVACIRVFPGIQPAMVDSILRTPGLRGLVLESFGAGNIPDGGGDGQESDPNLTQILFAAVERGIVVVNVSQCLTGSVSALYAPGMALSRAGVVLGSDMTTEAALTKLAYLLTFADDKVESDVGVSLNQAAIGLRMASNLRGEISEPGTTRFAHPLVGEPLSMAATPIRGADSDDEAGSVTSGPTTATAAATGLEQHAITSSSDLTLEPLGIESSTRPTAADQPSRRSLPHFDSLTSLNSPVGHVPSGVLTPDQAALATLSYAITAGDLALVKETMMRHPHPRRLLNEGDYAGNTALVCHSLYPILLSFILLHSHPHPTIISF